MLPYPEHTVIVVSGGVITAVYASNPEATTEIIDHDDLEAAGMSTLGRDAFEKDITKNLHLIY